MTRPSCVRNCLSLAALSLKINYTEAIALRQAWDGSVGIATRYRLHRRDSVPSRERMFVFSPQRPDHPTFYPVGTGGYLSGDKAAGALKITAHGQLEPIINTWTCNSIPPCAFIVWCLIKQREYFISTHYYPLFPAVVPVAKQQNIDHFFTMKLVMLSQ